jgi:hypothetical protein
VKLVEPGGMKTDFGGRSMDFTDDPGLAEYQRLIRDDRRAADPDRMTRPPAHELGEPAAFLVGQPPRRDWFCHPTSHLGPDSPVGTESEINSSFARDADRRVVNPVNDRGQRTDMEAAVSSGQGEAVSTTVAVDTASVSGCRWW